MPDEDRIAQLSEATSQTAAEVETQSARLVDIVARLESVENIVRGMRSAQVASAERVESLAAELDVSAEVRSLSEQLAAARAAQQRSADRIEALAAQLERLDGIENSVRHVSREVVAQIDERDAAVRAEIGAISERQSRERDATGRAIAGLIDRIDETASLQDKVSAAERRITETDAALGRLVARVEEVASERDVVKELVLQADLRQESRIDALGADLDDLGERVGTWQARIDVQNEAVRQARAVADGMEAQARGLHDAHHATAEAQRVAEGRVDTALEAMRVEASEAWDRFLSERRNDWQALDQARVERGLELSGYASDLAALAEQVEAAGQQVAEEQRQLAELLLTLRREMADVLHMQQSALEDAAEAIESGLPAAERSSQRSERREATRRALRAQRTTQEG